MGTAVETPNATNEVPRKIWTREEAHALVDMGFPNAEHLELIDGELIDKMGKKRPHVLWQSRFHEWLFSIFGPGRVESEAPSDVAGEDNRINEPEADLKVLRQRSSQYSSNPKPEDILLVIEISDSTVRFDLDQKARLYARAAYQEYWVVDIPDERLIVHRDPQNGAYQSVVTHNSHEPVSPLAAPGATVSLDSLK